MFQCNLKFEYGYMKLIEKILTEIVENTTNAGFLFIVICTLMSAPWLLFSSSSCCVLKWKNNYIDLYTFRKQYYENMHDDWLKIVFL